MNPEDRKRVEDIRRNTEHSHVVKALLAILDRLDSPPERIVVSSWAREAFTAGVAEGLELGHTTATSHGLRAAFKVILRENLRPHVIAGTLVYGDRIYRTLTGEEMPS